MDCTVLGNYHDHTVLVLKKKKKGRVFQICQSSVFVPFFADTVLSKRNHEKYIFAHFKLVVFFPITSREKKN